MVDLKDAFFSIFQYLFAFEWEDPQIGLCQQYTCTVLPQGFRDSSHLFERAVGQDLKDLHFKNGSLLQYVDYPLIYSLTRKLS